jgi:hypothetical protein
MTHGTDCATDRRRCRSQQLLADIDEVQTAVLASRVAGVRFQLDEFAGRLMRIHESIIDLDERSWSGYRANLRAGLRSIAADLTTESTDGNPLDSVYLPLTRLELAALELRVSRLTEPSAASTDLIAFARRMIDSYDATSEDYRYGDIERIMEVIRDSLSHDNVT